MTTLEALELDLDVFTGPFDLLLALVLREEIDLLELPLADVVVAYLDHLEARGELDLETATEFIVLIAALLEIKSRLLLHGDDDEDLLDLEPGEAAEELLARMLQAHRFAGAAEHLRELLTRQEGVRYREAPLPVWLRKRTFDMDEPPVAQSPELLGQAIGGLLRTPPLVDVRHIHRPRVSLGERLSALRALLRRGRFDFDEAVRDADRMTVAVTVFALLELYRRGEVDWEQAEPFGPIAVTSSSARRPAAAAEDVGAAVATAFPS